MRTPQMSSQNKSSTYQISSESDNGNLFKFGEKVRGDEGEFKWGGGISGKKCKCHKQMTSQNFSIQQVSSKLDNRKVFKF